MLNLSDGVTAVTAVTSEVTAVMWQSIMDSGFLGVNFLD
jgi:hypothetical protein